MPFKSDTIMVYKTINKVKLTMNILETRKIAKHFGGVHAVDSLSVDFEKGKITGLIGPNGSGKSTLINLLTGIMPMDGGSVVVSSDTAVSKLLPHERSD